MPLSIYFFGPPRFERFAQPVHVSRRRVVALAAYLTVTDRPHSRESLATLFWPEHSHRSALKNLRRELARLKDALGSGLLTVDRTQVSVNPTAPVWIDVRQFQRHLARVHERTNGSDPSCSRCLPALTAAADLYTDDFMAGFNLPDCPPFDEWQFFQREHFRQGFTEVLRRLTDSFIQRGEYERALQYAQRWRALDHLHEPAQRALMRIYAQAGQQAAALHQYKTLVHVLREELGVPPTEETTALYAAIRTGRAPGAAGEHMAAPIVRSTQVTPEASHRPPHKLPSYPTPFIGRAQELTMLLLRLQEPACRLLTLVGPGGIGKTRLAVEASRRLVETTDAGFDDGIFFVPLASVRTPDDIPYAIVDALGEHFYGTAPTRQKLLHYLRNKRMLLVLDNVEHLLQGVDRIKAILDGAPEVTLLVTSCQALNIQGEWLHAINGMSVPPQYRHSGRQPQEATMQQYDAVALFTECARRVNPDFSPDAEEEQVIRICRLVEGSPLAIELAAAWLNVLPAAEVADQLAHNLDILTSRHRDIAERHRSMRAVLAQTWDLLDTEERTALKRLSVFRGGFTARAAESVTGATLLVLADLVEKSWVRIDATGRYQIHDLLCQYAAERLDAAGAADEARAAHAAYYLTALQEREADLRGRRQLEALTEIETELDNVRTAWQTALDRHDEVAIDGALDSLYLFFDKLSLQREGAALLEQARRRLARSEPATTTRLYGRLLARLAMLQTRYMSSPNGVEDRLDAAMALARRHEDRLEIAFCLAAHGHLTVDVMRDYPTGIRYFQQSRDLYTELDNTFGIAHTTHLLGYCHLVLTGPETSARFLRDAVYLARQIGDNVRVGLCLAGLSMISFFLGEYAAAAAYAEETGTIAAETGNRATLAQSQALLALTCLLEGQVDRARTYAEASLLAARESSFTMSLTYALIASSTVESMSGNIGEGVRLADEALASHVDPYGGMLAHWAGALAHSGMQDHAGTREHLRATLTLAQELRVPAIAVLALPIAALLRIQQGCHAEAIILLALASVHPLAGSGWMEAWSLLRQLHTTLETELGGEKFGAGWQRGTELELDATVSELLRCL